VLDDERVAFDGGSVGCAARAGEPGAEVVEGFVELVALGLEAPSLGLIAAGERFDAGLVQFGVPGLCVAHLHLDLADLHRGLLRLGVEVGELVEPRRGLLAAGHGVRGVGVTESAQVRDLGVGGGVRHVLPPARSRRTAPRANQRQGSIAVDVDAARLVEVDRSWSQAASSRASILSWPAGGWRGGRRAGRRGGYVGGRCSRTGRGRARPR
jgi:hypothetical protein